MKQTIFNKYIISFPLPALLSYFFSLEPPSKPICVCVCPRDSQQAGSLCLCPALTHVSKHSTHSFISLFGFGKSRRSRSRRRRRHCRLSFSPSFWLQTMLHSLSGSSLDPVRRWLQTPPDGVLLLHKP